MTIAQLAPIAVAVPRRKCVAFTRKLTVCDLSQSESRTIFDTLYALYLATCTGLSRTQFETLFAPNQDTRLALFYGDDGTLAGVSLASLTPVIHKEKEHAVFAAGVFFRLDYRGGAAGARFGLAEALKFKLRHPLTPLAYLTRANSPATYRLRLGTMSRAYPRPDAETPADVVELVRKVNAHRQTEAVDGSPWLVKATATPRDPQRLRASSLQQDSLARFYQEQNPQYAAGTSLQIWIPLDLPNILGALSRLARCAIGI